MSRGFKLFLGLSSFLPIITFIMFKITSNLYLDAYSKGERLNPLDKELGVMVLLIIILLAIDICLIIYYIKLIARNPKFNHTNHQGDKLLWQLLIVFIWPIGMIIYFFKEIMPSSNYPLIKKDN